MADLVTHLAVVLLPAAAVRSPRVGLVALGAVLPDLPGRVVPLALDLLLRLGAPLPSWVTWPWSALHEPLGWSLTAGLAACAFVRRDRAAAFGLLALGCATHTGVDLLQDHHGEGYRLFAPLSTASFELGWIGSEATVAFALPLLAASAVAWSPALIERLLGRIPAPSWTGAAAVLVPVHAALPVALWLAAPDPGSLGWGLAWLHLAGAGFLLGAVRWWWHRVPELLVLLAADHAATFFVGAAVLSFG